MPLLSTDDAPAEHMRELPQGPLGPPAPRGPRVEPRGARAGRNRARRVARAVPGCEAHRTKIGDAHAERAPEAPMDPTDPWGTLGAHVVEAKGARGARVGGGVSVVSLQSCTSYFRAPVLRLRLTLTGTQGKKSKTIATMLRELINRAALAPSAGAVAAGAEQQREASNEGAQMASPLSDHKPLERPRWARCCQLELLVL